MPVSPLNIQVRMVNDEGQPTPEFMRWWQEFLATVNPLAYTSGVSDLLDVIGSTWGSILIRGETGWALLAPGTSGTALITQGAAADPVWGLQATTFIDLTDTPSDYTSFALQAIRVNAGETALEFYTPSSAADFVDLGDTPANFTGDALKSVRVNAGETALEFYTPTAAGTWLGLSDTPAAFTGQAGQIVAVNSGETAVEFIAPPSGGGAPLGFAKFTKPGNTFTAVNSGTPTENAYVSAHDTWRLTMGSGEGLSFALQAGLTGDGVVIFRTHMRYIDDTFIALGVCYGENSSSKRTGYVVAFGNKLLKQYWNGTSFVSESTITPLSENALSFAQSNYMYWKFDRSSTTITVTYSRDGLTWYALGSGTTTENSMSDVDEVGIYLNTAGLGAGRVIGIECFGLDTSQQNEAGT